MALCGGAGLALARAMLFPGRYGRVDEIAHAGRGAAAVVLGCVVMFFMAALIEGFFRQLETDPAIRYAMGGVTGAFWLAYFVWGGRRER